MGFKTNIRTVRDTVTTKGSWRRRKDGSISDEELQARWDTIFKKTSEEEKPKVEESKKQD